MSVLGPLARLCEEAKRLIHTMMDMDFGWVQTEIGVLPSLDGRALKISELSEGQRVLLYYVACVLGSLAGGDAAPPERRVEGFQMMLQLYRLRVRLSPTGSPRPADEKKEIDPAALEWLRRQSNKVLEYVWRHNTGILDRETVAKIEADELS